LPVYNPDGSYYQPANNFYVNPLYLLKEVYSKQRENFFQSSVKADYELLKGLKVGVLGALSRANDVYDYFRPGIVERNEKSVATKSNINKQIFSGDIHGNYRKSFGNHTLDITGAYEYNKFVNDGFAVKARGFLVPELLNNNLGTATDVQTSDISSFKNEVKLISFLEGPFTILMTAISSRPPFAGMVLQNLVPTTAGEISHLLLRHGEQATKIF
jgi:iron complex outermembrane receptor protein